MQTVAQGWLVLELSGSALQLGVVAFAGSIPSLLLAPLAGVVADRGDRRKLLIGAQVTQMTCALLLAAAAGFGFANVPLIAGVAVVNGVANAMTTPAHQSLFLDLVGRADLMNAIALNSMQFNLARVVGPILAGLTIATLGESACFVVNAVSYLALLYPLALLPRLATARRKTRGAWADLLAALRFARRDPVLPPLLALSGAIAIFGVPAVTLAPVFARRLLHVGPQGLGGMLAAVGIGAVATALTLASLGDFPRKGRAVEIAAGAFALALAGFAISRSFLASLLPLLVLGGAMMSSSSLINTLMQKRAPDRMRGRVISLYVLAWLGLVPVGNLCSGAIAERFGPAAALWAGAAGIAATLLLVRIVKPIPASLA